MTQEQFLAGWTAQPAAQRTAKMMRWDFDDLRAQYRKGFRSENERQNFIERRAAWFDKLRARMKNFSISKEDLFRFGLDFSECKRFYYMAV